MFLDFLFIFHCHVKKSRGVQSGSIFHFPGGRPATTIQYDELKEAVGHDLMDRIFWPVVCRLT